MTNYEPTRMAIRNDNINGSKVLSVEGEKLGKVSHIYLDPESLQIEGIDINTGLFSGDMYVSREYIDKLENDAVVLNMIPAEQLKKRKVIDSEGNEIGKVKEVKREGHSNEVISFVVGRGMTKNDIIIASNSVDHIGKHIMLTREASAGMES